MERTNLMTTNPKLLIEILVSSDLINIVKNNSLDLCDELRRSDNELLNDKHPSRDEFGHIFGDCLTTPSADTELADYLSEVAHILCALGSYVNREVRWYNRKEILDEG